jgi:hypothetical protein
MWSKPFGTHSRPTLAQASLLRSLSMRIVVTLIVLVVGCDSNHNAEPAKSPGVAQNTGPDCAGAANHLVAFQTNGGDKQKASAAITASCEKLKWTADAVDCVEGLKTLDDASSCMRLMTADQNLALEDIINSSAGPAN